MSWKDWFRRPNPPQNTTGHTQPPTCETPPPPERLPRRWEILEGHGLKIGTAFEHRDNKQIQVRWEDIQEPMKLPTRRHWVDLEALTDDLRDRDYRGFPAQHHITLPIRLHWVSRGDDMEDSVMRDNNNW